MSDKPWRLVETDPPKMEYFASAEDIECNRNAGTVNGLWKELEISYMGNPDHMILQGAVRINFENQVKWEAHGKDIGTPKWWRDYEDSNLYNGEE